MPCKEEKDKRSAVKHLYRQHRFFVVMLLRMTNYFLIVHCEFCILNCFPLCCIPYSDCFLHLLRASATVTREPWRKSVCAAIRGLRRHGFRATCMPVSLPSERILRIRSPGATGLRPVPCAASSICTEVVFVRSSCRRCRPFMADGGPFFGDNFSVCRFFPIFAVPSRKAGKCGKI